MSNTPRAAGRPDAPAAPLQRPTAHGGRGNPSWGRVRRAFAAARWGRGTSNFYRNHYCRKAWAYGYALRLATAGDTK